MSEQNENNAAAVIAAARESVEPVEIQEKVPYVLPPGRTQANVGAVSLEKYRDEPDRKRGNYWPQTVDSFIDYVEDQKTDQSTIWVTPNEGHIEALLNDHGATDEPGWGDHRAILDLIESPEWKFWLLQDGQMLPQVQFANHIEEGLEDIVTPDGAEMLEIARSIEGTNNVAFKSKVDLTSGEVRIGYEEDIETKAAGQLEIPREFEVGIEPFVGEEAFRLKCRLRYRISGGSLTLGYKIDRPDAAVRVVLEGIHRKLAEKFEGLVYFGSTPSGDRATE